MISAPRAWRGIRRRPAALVAFGILCLYLLAAVAAPVLAPHDPYAVGGPSVAPPSAAHLFGTDSLGRDIFSRVLYGAGISLRVAALSVLLALGAGGFLGGVSGYWGGRVDAVLSRLLEMLFALPAVLLAIVVTAVLQPGLTSVTIAIGVVYTPIFARVTRGAVLARKKERYVEAARASGAGGMRILFRHLLPNIADVLVVQTTLSFAFAILAEAALSFLGLSGQSDAPSWGLMLREGKNWVEQAWWIALFPGLAITTAVYSLNLLGDALRDSYDVRS